MRVLFVTTTYPLSPGDSIPAFVADLAQSLVRDHGVSVKVIAPHHPSAKYRQTVEGVEIERFGYALDPKKQCVAYGGGIPDNLRNFPRAKWQLPGFFASMALAVGRNLADVDVIHAHWVEPALIAKVANWRHRPMVVSVHSLKPKASRLHRFTLARVNRVLFNSQYTLGQARDKGYQCRGQVVYQGYDDRLIGTQTRNGALRRKLGIPEQATVIAALGRFIEVKGLHVLARAADQILGVRPQAHLVMAGDGPQRAEIQSILSGSRHRDRIHLPGALARKEVADFLAEADVFVNPGVIDSRGRAEGLGITTIEAMASGLACVGSRVGGIAETIADGVTGWLVPPGDENALAGAVGRMLDDAPQRMAMGDAARRMARERFTWPVLAGEVKKVYGELIGANRMMKYEG